MLEENRIGNLAKADREAEVFKPVGNPSPVLFAFSII